MDDNRPFADQQPDEDEPRRASYLALEDTRHPAEALLDEASPYLSPKNLRVLALHIGELHEQTRR